MPQIILKHRTRTKHGPGGETAIISLRIEMLRRGLTDADMANSCGISNHQMVRELRLGVPSLALRFRIERLFDFPLALWSSAQEIKFRKAYIRVHGQDPRDFNREEFMAIGRRFGIKQAKSRLREDYFQLLMKWFNSNSGNK